MFLFLQGVFVFYLHCCNSSQPMKTPSAVDRLYLSPLNPLTTDLEVAIVHVVRSYR